MKTEQCEHKTVIDVNYRVCLNCGTKIKHSEKVLE